MNVLILDDDKEFVERLKNDLFVFLSGFNDHVHFDGYHSNFNNLSLKDSYDLAFIDIDLNEADGISIAKKIKKGNLCNILIFVSAQNHLIHDTMIVRPFFFVRKSHYKEDLYVCFEIIKDSIRDKYLINVRNKTNKSCISAHQIIYIESLEHSLKVYTHNNVYYDSRTLKAFKENLPDKFVQIHKSYIINLDFLDTFNANEVILMNGFKVSFGRKYKNDFEKIYKEYLLQ